MMLMKKTLMLYSHPCWLKRECHLWELELPVLVSIFHSNSFTHLGDGRPRKVRVSGNFVPISFPTNGFQSLKSRYGTSLRAAHIPRTIENYILKWPS